MSYMEVNDYTGLIDGFIEEADKLIDPIDRRDDTTIWMLTSDHGYAEYVIAPVGLPNSETHGLLLVEDAGETQRRYTVVALSGADNDWPSMMSHSFFMDEHEARDAEMEHRDEEVK